jgi:hypothetical protein
MEDDQEQSKSKSQAHSRMGKSQVVNKSIDDTIRRLIRFLLTHFLDFYFVEILEEIRFYVFVSFSMQHYHVNLLM